MTTFLGMPVWLKGSDYSIQCLMGMHCCAHDTQFPVFPSSYGRRLRAVPFVQSRRQAPRPAVTDCSRCVFAVSRSPHHKQTP
jgi:hypothetical protein